MRKKKKGRDGSGWRTTFVGWEGGEWTCLCGGSDWTTYSLVVGTSITFWLQNANVPFVFLRSFSKTKRTL